jgi:hypothetical protein
MEETRKLVLDILSITVLLPDDLNYYEGFDIAVKIMALQEQKKANELLKKIDESLTAIQNIL